MKYFGVALATAGLLIQASSAFAISFQPLRQLALPEGETTAPAQKWTVGLAASSWDLPSIGGAGVVNGVPYTWTSKLTPRVRPLVSVDYQLAPKISVGGWYNAISWDAPTTVTAAGASAVFSQSVDGTMFEVHGTYDLPKGFQGQLGFQRLSGDVSAQGQKQSFDSNWITLWGYKQFDLIKKAEPKGSLGLVAGLGIQQGLDNTSGSLGGNAQVGLSYAFTERYSANVSAWFNDITHSESSVTRWTFGLAGRF